MDNRFISLGPPPKAARPARRRFGLGDDTLSFGDDYGGDTYAGSLSFGTDYSGSSGSLNFGGSASSSSGLSDQVTGGLFSLGTAIVNAGAKVGAAELSASPANGLLSSLGFGFGGAFGGQAQAYQPAPAPTSSGLGSGLVLGAVALAIGVVLLARKG